MGGYVYIVTNKRYGVLYIGVTSNIARRAYEHRESLIDGFTKKYQCHHLVWYQHFDRIEDAIACEKRMKKWERMWKINAIEAINPGWKDLYEDLNA